MLSWCGGQCGQCVVGGQCELRWAICVWSVGVISQCVVSLCGGGSVWSVGVIGAQLVDSWCDGVCAQLCWGLVGGQLVWRVVSVWLVNVMWSQ